MVWDGKWKGKNFGFEPQQEECKKWNTKKTEQKYNGQWVCVTLCMKSENKRGHVNVAFIFVLLHCSAESSRIANAKLSERWIMNMNIERIKVEKKTCV